MLDSKVVSDNEVLVLAVVDSVVEVVDSEVLVKRVTVLLELQGHSEMVTVTVTGLAITVTV